ncbi:MAG TPA: hypothetical protein VJ891_09400 [Casimicrobiaceae bacterium]|nr:hypothetical protein [Casimicrobiaceae bacterium]
MLDRAIVVAHENPGLARDLVATARDLIAGHLHIEEYRLLDAELEASEQVIAEQSREGTA